MNCFGLFDLFECIHGRKCVRNVSKEKSRFILPTEKQLNNWTTAKLKRNWFYSTSLDNWTTNGMCAEIQIPFGSFGKKHSLFPHLTFFLLLQMNCHIELCIWIRLFWCSATAGSFDAVRKYAYIDDNCMLFRYSFAPQICTSFVKWQISYWLPLLHHTIWLPTLLQAI